MPLIKFFKFLKFVKKLRNYIKPELALQVLIFNNFIFDFMFLREVK